MRQSARIGRTRLLFAAAAATLVLTACGGSDDDNSTAAAPVPPAPAPSPAPSPSPPPPPPPPPPPGPPPAPPPAPPPPPPIAVTPPGIPEGFPTSATIGPGGGSLGSSDGRLTVTVPAGALAANINFGIQPITATAPGALGSAYRLTPEGQNFAQPVTLTFKYSAAEGAASARDALRVATQTAQGRWSLPPTTHDAAQRTLVVTTTHFSDWANISGLLLRPADSVVAVNKKLNIYFIDCGWEPDPNDPNAPHVMRECQPFDAGGATGLTWSVNGVAGGSSSSGTVQRQPNNNARYTAPATVPAQNPVAVSVSDGRGGTLVADVTVVTDIRAYGGPFFAKTTTSAAEVEISGNLAVFHIPDPGAEAMGQRFYGAATGSAAVRARIPDCDWATGTDFVDPYLTTVIMTEGGSGPLANTYQITLQVRPTMTFRCANGLTITAPVVAQAVVGLTTNCAAPPLEEGTDALTGSWNCNLGQGAMTRANWSLRASR